MSFSVHKPEGSDALFEHGDTLEPKQWLDIGPENMRFVPLHLVNHNLTQTRRAYAQGPLQELQRSIVHEEPDGTHRYELQNAPHYNFVPETDIYGYLSQHAVAYRTGSVVSPDELIPCCWQDVDPSTSGTDQGQEKGFIIVLSGHRRTKAIINDVVETGRNLDTVRITAFVDYARSLHTAIDKQYRENNHERLSPFEDAQAIHYRYTYGLGNIITRNDGTVGPEFISAADCARRLGVSYDKVLNAISFMRLPQTVQDRVEHGFLPYSRALDIYQVMRAYAGYCVRKMDAEGFIDELIDSIGVSSTQVSSLRNYLIKDLATIMFENSSHDIIETDDAQYPPLVKKYRLQIDDEISHITDMTLSWASPKFQKYMRARIDDFSKHIQAGFAVIEDSSEIEKRAQLTRYLQIAAQLRTIMNDLSKQLEIVLMPGSHFKDRSPLMTPRVQALLQDIMERLQVGDHQAIAAARAMIRLLDVAIEAETVDAQESMNF